ncbi:anillin/rhotekin rtkn [Anaeramoeba flamelloides]|uniref:Anillin/rhotekin rtkn n=1 Tax=Anaeramoeba flamelloides TaxID=1746091 RepID=A0ABQ8X321_9EUKA|nr:anillin/rhotekin rtkn [Anaeramoeba flamelloides]
MDYSNKNDQNRKGVLQPSFLTNNPQQKQQNGILIDFNQTQDNSQKQSTPSHYESSASSGATEDTSTEPYSNQNKHKKKKKKKTKKKKTKKKKNKKKKNKKKKNKQIKSSSSSGSSLSSNSNSNRSGSETTNYETETETETIHNAEIIHRRNFDQNYFIDEDISKYLKWLQTRSYKLRFGHMLKRAKYIYLSEFCTLTCMSVIVFVLLLVATAGGLIAILSSMKFHFSDFEIIGNNSFDINWNTFGVIVGVYFFLWFLSVFFAIGWIKVIIITIQNYDDERINESHSLKFSPLFSAFQSGLQPFVGVVFISFITHGFLLITLLTLPKYCAVVPLYFVLIWSWSPYLWIVHHKEIKYLKVFSLSRKFVHMNVFGNIWILVVILIIFVISIILFGIVVIIAFPYCAIFLGVIYHEIFGIPGIKLSQNYVVVNRKSDNN